nr:P-loop NTPase fold protein [uncultured Fluviicola sp.]
MQIKHKLTGEVTEIDFEIWSEEYIPKKLDANYDILTKDTVFLREILDSGERKFIQERERNNAIKLVTNYPHQFEFVEKSIKVGNTSLSFEATHNMEYDSFKLMFAEQLKEKLDDAYFLVTGKFPPTINNNEKLISEQLQLPILSLSDDEKKYLREIYSRFIAHDDENLKPYTLVAKIWKYPPADFNPENISPILLNRGIEITPLGIYQIDPKSKLPTLVENILHLLRDIIHKNEGIEEISSRTVLEAFPDTKFNDIYLAFKLIYRLGSFSTGMSHSTNVASLRISSDAVYKNILGFNSLANYYKSVGFKANPVEESDNDFQLDGLVVNDSTDWFEDAQSHLNGQNHIIVWWDKLPSGINSIGTFKKLRSKLERDGYFDIYYCTKNEAYYRARVLDFKTKVDYNISEWRNRFPGLQLRDFDKYIDDRTDKSRSANIVFVTDNIEALRPRIPISSFSFPSPISAPVRNNLQPFISVNIEDDHPNSSNEVKKRVVNLEVSSQFIISENVEGVIGVVEQAQEVSKLLVNLKAEQGMMIGVFGRWGRGKTFFWKHMKSYLGTLENKPFIFCEFHAWKYQDTPASWAYLYESITKTCIDNSEYHEIFKIKIIRKNIFKLNLAKNGSFKLIAFLLIFLISIIWFFLIPYSTKIEWSKKIFLLILSGTIAISSFIPAIVFYTRHIPKAIDLFKKYSKVVSFKNLLGLQSEIQNELIEVLKASIPDPKSQRLLLFVDDLDRCSEDRIIQIIDSLKVMLEDPEISARVVVLTAIDERILKRAIAHKYYDSINRNFIENAERKKAMETLVREYMDKLFISGIKLTTLSTQEKGEIFDAFSKNQDKVNYKVVSYDSDEIDETEEIDEVYNQSPKIVQTNIEDTQKVMTSKDSINSYNIEFEHGDPDYEIEEFEYDYLKLMLKYHIDATPRSIRIYYYRYLLAKKFLAHQLPYGSGLSYVWGIFDDKKILPELIIYYSTEKNLDDLSERLKQLEFTEDEFAELQLFDKYSFNRLLAIELFKVVEMVVAY